MDRNSKQIIIPNLCDDCVEAMTKVLKVKDKVNALRAKKNYKSAKKVIDDELLKATVASNKAQKTLLEHLEAMAEHGVGLS